MYTAQGDTPARVYGAPIGENAADPIAPAATVSSLSADGQLSFLGAYVEDLNGQPGQSRFISWPDVAR